MTAAEIAEALGRPSREGRSYRCQCPVHGGRSLIVADGISGRLLVKCWAGCDFRDVFAQLRHRGFLRHEAGGANGGPAPAAIRRARDAEARDRLHRTAGALELWTECYEAPDTIVQTYLHSRGLAGSIPSTIRMHGMMHHRESGGRRPAMVGLVEHAERRLCCSAALALRRPAGPHCDATRCGHGF